MYDVDISILHATLNQLVALTGARERNTSWAALPCCIINMLISCQHEKWTFSLILN